MSDEGFHRRIPPDGTAEILPKYCGASIVAGSEPHYEIGPRYRVLRPRWATLQGTATYSGLSKRLLEVAGEEGHIRIAHAKRGNDKKRGRRLVDLQSLDAWIVQWVGR